jgi:hypothetical protein
MTSTATDVSYRDSLQDVESDAGVVTRDYSAEIQELVRALADKPDMRRVLASLPPRTGVNPVCIGIINKLNSCQDGISNLEPFDAQQDKGR